MGSDPVVVLLAEDDVMVRNLVRQLLEKEGYEVLAAADGAEALELSRRHTGPIQVLLTDVEMPKLNGLELCDRLRAERPGIKVLLMSGYTSNQLRAAKLELPFIKKPFVVKEFRDKLKQTLECPPAPPQEI